MVRDVTFHQCKPGSIRAIFGSSLLLLLTKNLPVKVFLWVLCFFLLLKTNISKFQFNQDRGHAKIDVASTLNIH